MLEGSIISCGFSSPLRSETGNCGILTMSRDSRGSDVMLYLPIQSAKGRSVTVVIMIVRDEYQINFRQLGCFYPFAGKAFRADKGDGRKSFAENRVDQNAFSAHPEEDGAVPQPNHGKTVTQILQIQLLPGQWMGWPPGNPLFTFCGKNGRIISDEERRFAMLAVFASRSLAPCRINMRCYIDILDIPHFAADRRN